MKIKTSVVQFSCILILGAVLIIGLYSNTISTAHAAETIELRFATLLPTQDIICSGPQFMFKELEERTGGKVKVTPYYSQSLGKAQEMLDMIDKGIADIILFPTSVFPRVFMMSEANNLPGLIPNYVIVTEVMYELGYRGLLDKDFEGYKVLLWEGTDPMGFGFVDKKVTKLEELQKMKIRSPGGIASEILATLGCSVVTIPSADIYIALDRGVAEGLITMPTWFLSMKINEVAKYFLFKSMGIGANVTLMTQAKWDSLPVDIRAVWTEIMAEAKYRYFEEAKKRIPDIKEHFTKLGVETYTLDPKEEARWDKLLDGYIEKWIADREAKGYPAREVVETIKEIVKRYE